MRRGVVAVLAWVLVAAGGWTQTSAPPPPVCPPATPTVPATPSAKVVASTPPASPAILAGRLASLPLELPGWQIIGEPEACDRSCLAEQLPQETDLILSYGFLWGLTLRLMPPDPCQEIVCRFFAMTEDLDAFGLFARHRNAKSVPAELTTQSFWNGNELHIWRDTFYIRLTPASGDKLLRAAVLAAGEAILERLALPVKLPVMMRLMPQVRNHPLTLRYYRQSVLGQAALGYGLVDSYLEDGDELTLALLRAADEAAAVLLYGKVLEILDGCGPPTAIPDLGKAAAFANSGQFGLSFVMREGPYVAVAIKVHDRRTAEGLLRMVGTNIRVSRF